MEFKGSVVFSLLFTSFLGARSPVAYQLMKNNKDTQNGINFAYGGTGVFRTQVDLPNITTQIDLFQQLINKNVFTTLDLSSSIALVSLAGNDYSTYLAKNGSFQGLLEFIRSVVDQLVVDVRRIHGIGIKKIGITGVPPLGYLSPTNNIADLNKFSVSHNKVLKGEIEKLNNEAAAGAPVFIYLDLYTAFISALQLGQNPPGNKLIPCCSGDCGFVDKNGEKKYGVCENPNQSFFWDSIHPSNYGWGVVYSALNVSIQSLCV